MARTQFLSATSTNDEVRRFVALRDSLPVESVDEVGGALGDAGAHRVHFALTHPERVEGHELRAALLLLTDLTAGTPVEWVARRALALRREP